MTSVWAADPRLSPDGATVAYVVTAVDKEENSLSLGDLARGGGRIGASAAADVRQEGRLDAALVSRRQPARVHVESRRRPQAAVRAPARGRGADVSHRPEGGRRAARMVSGRDAHRLRVPRARPGVRGDRRQAPPPAPVHTAPLQARLGRLDRRPANPRLRRAGGRLRARAPGDGRRLRGRLAGLVSRLLDDRLRVGTRRRLGHEVRAADLERPRGWR